jgi:hypothetical protein
MRRAPILIAAAAQATNFSEKGIANARQRGIMFFVFWRQSVKFRRG